eukprot:gb/GFBE01001729.1/.p1 GENE.gb/GFBE01001729.1/~~gb/GFBE01001729.1/.p1  ORF type:complete len:190 (+),score=34.87 gb/GFBE01001729.1/:1-570(+)
MAAGAFKQRRSPSILIVCGLAVAGLCWCSGNAFLAGPGQDTATAPTVLRRGAVAAALLAAAPAWATRPADVEWLTAKEKEPGVIKLPSGLMYKVLEEGPAGGPSPKVNTKCSCTYAGQLTNGKQFDAGTLSFAPNQVIKGWTEAMQLMKIGDKWELYIPSELAYGERGAGGAIPPGAALQFQMKINKFG